jgi:hypothetical protein
LKIILDAQSFQRKQVGTQRANRSSSAAGPHMINAFIDRGINLSIGDIPGLFSASIQERFEVLCDCRAIP